MTHRDDAQGRNRRSRSAVALAPLVAVALIGWPAGCQSRQPTTSAVPLRTGPSPGPSWVVGGTPAARVDPAVWPVHGQAAFVMSGQGDAHASPRQQPAPIASVAKVMTAYVVLRDHPLGVAEAGPGIGITDADVADAARRRARAESVVSVASGEVLTEAQALQALLLPSANNIAVVLARWDAGSVSGFVDRMNATARALGMTHTRYTDPSGYDSQTVSTAMDQLRVVDRAMALSVFAATVATPSATLPVAGTVRNTDVLLGHRGFVGVKTGSDTAAGGCFAFRAVRLINGRTTTITGVVLGQRGSDLLGAGLLAADRLVDRLTGGQQPPHLPPPGPPPPGAAPGTDT